MIYLACPYSNKNPEVAKARYEFVTIVAGVLMRRGMTVFSPVTHSRPIDMTFEEPEDWEFWKQQDFDILENCDALCVLMIDGWKESKGVTEEIQFAKEKRIDVCYLEPPYFEYQKYRSILENNE